jgi:hypothetical protein
MEMNQNKQKNNNSSTSWGGCGAQGTLFHSCAATLKIKVNIFLLWDSAIGP